MSMFKTNGGGDAPPEQEQQGPPPPQLPPLRTFKVTFPNPESGVIETEEVTAMLQGVGQSGTLMFTSIYLHPVFGPQDYVVMAYRTFIRFKEVTVIPSSLAIH